MPLQKAIPFRVLERVSYHLKRALSATKIVSQFASNLRLYFGPQNRLHKSIKMVLLR
jgi:hypothetical protein